MKYPKSSLVLIVFIFILSGNYSFSADRISPQSLGLRFNQYGDYEERMMNKDALDTIAVGIFTYDDFLYDAAVYHRSKDAIILYKNLGNGFLSVIQEFDMKERSETNRGVKSIEVKFDGVTIERPNSRADLLIKYNNGESELISNRRLMRGDAPEDKAPYKEFLDDPRVFVYDISFIQKWQSERSGEANWTFTTGDVNGNGFNNIIYSFFRIWDSGGSALPARIVVFESIGGDQYIVEWDSLLQYGGYNLGFSLSDYNNNGYKEFMAASYVPYLGRVTFGFFECLGPKKYRYLHSSYQTPYPVFPFAVAYRENITVNGSTGRGAWMCFSNLVSGHPKSYVGKFRYSASSPIYMGLDNQFGNYIEVPVKSYEMAFGDIDGDGKEELVMGDAQWVTNYINYMDSTGIPTNYGYELTRIIPNAPVNAGYMVLKDMDGNSRKEIITGGFGYGTGSLAVVKHTGQPGENNFTTVWFDSTDLKTPPNMGVDTNSIDGKFSFLYPTVYTPLAQIYTYTRNGLYSFYRSSNTMIDSAAALRSKLLDINQNGKMNIVAPLTYYPAPFLTGNGFMTVFDQVGTIGINQTGTSVPESFKLYQNYPNPFNSQTTIKFDIRKAGRYKLEIYDVSGRRIEEKLNDILNLGTYEINFDAGSLSSGVYFYKLSGKSFKDVKKFVLVK